MAAGRRFRHRHGWRVVQLTPPGSPCSIHFGKGVTTAAPGSFKNLYLVVADIEAARAELIARGADVSEVFHFDAFGGPRRGRGPHPTVAQLPHVRHVQRSGRQQLAAPGDQGAPSRTRTRAAGRRDADGASARGRGAPWQVRTDRSEAPLVGVVRRLHRRARARQDSRGGRQGCCASHGRCAP